MYLLESMIDMGLPKGKIWPSDLHRQLAVSILIGNPNVRTMDSLQESIEIIFKIPKDEIPTLTYENLINYGFNAGVYV